MFFSHTKMLPSVAVGSWPPLTRLVASTIWRSWATVNASSGVASSVVSVAAVVPGEAAFVTVFDPETDALMRPASAAAGDRRRRRLRHLFESRGFSDEGAKRLRRLGGWLACALKGRRGPDASAASEGKPGVGGNWNLTRIEEASADESASLLTTHLPGLALWIRIPLDHAGVRSHRRRRPARRCGSPSSSA